MYIELILVAVILLIIYDRKNKTYWLDKGVYSPPPTFIVGFMNFSSSVPFWERFNEIYYKKAKLHKVFGMYEFFKPKIVITDPDLIKNVLVKDFDHFTDRRTITSSSKNDKIMQSWMVNATGERWKALRSATTPVFSSGKLKGMFPIIEREVQKCTEFCHSAMLDGKSVDVVKLTGKYSLNVIQSCSFGMDGEGFKEAPSQMYNAIVGMVNISYMQICKYMLFTLSPKLFNLLRFSLTTAPQQKLQEYMKEVIAQRRQSDICRNDFIYIMLEAEKISKRLEDGNSVVDDSVVISQSTLFLFAGFDTVRNNLAFLLYNIAKYPEEQEILREELMQIVTDEEIDYQKLQELHYLDAFISETMRVFPTAFMLERMCTKDYQIPDTDIVVPKGMLLSIPTYSLHYDPQFWDEPEEFRPSRFLKENRHLVNTYAYLPFGLGPRNCIGNRFALLEMKMLVAKLLLSFDIKLKPGSSLKFANSFFSFRPDEKQGINVILNKL